MTSITPANPYMFNASFGAANNNAINRASEQLSSGLRINRAADDPAGLQIANLLSSETLGQTAALRNVNDARSVTQVADAGLEGFQAAVDRIRELSVQSANSILSDSDRSSLQSEVSSLQEQIQDQIDNGRFNDQQLFDGSFNTSFQVGSDAGDQIDSPNLDAASALQDVLSIDISTQQGASDALDITEQASEALGEIRGDIGAFANRLDSATNSLLEGRIQSESARSQIADSDYAQSLAELIQAQTRDEVGITLQAQANADRGNSLRLLLGGLNA